MLVALKRYPLQVNLLLGGTFLLTMGRAITLPYLVIYLSTQFGLPVSRIGLIMGGALFGGSLLSLYGGFLIDQMPGFRLILGFGSCFVAAFAGMLLTSQLWLFFLFLLGFNFAYSVTDVVVKTLFGRLLPAGEQGRAFSVRYTLINLAYAIGPSSARHWRSGTRMFPSSSPQPWAAFSCWPSCATATAACARRKGRRRRPSLP